MNATNKKSDKDKNYPQVAKSRSASIATPCGLIIPIPVPMNYVAVQVNEEYKGEGAREGQPSLITLRFMPITKRMQGFSLHQMKALIAESGYKLVTPDALIDGWARYIPGEDEIDPPSKQITIERSETGWVWRMPDAAQLAHVLRLISRGGDTASFAELPSVA